MTRARRRESALEQIIRAFRSKRYGTWPFKEKPPTGIETFDVPVKVRKILSIMGEREEAAKRLMSHGSCNDGGVWLRRNMLAEGIEYLANDYVRAVYHKSERYSVDYYARFRCTFTLT